MQLGQFVLFKTAIGTGLSRYLNLVTALWQVVLCEFRVEHLQLKEIGSIFFKKLGGHIVTGPTGTNVNDLYLLLAL